MKKIFEKIVEGILACSGFVTSLTIVLIVVFLFSEALIMAPFIKARQEITETFVLNADGSKCYRYKLGRSRR